MGYTHYFYQKRDLTDAEWNHLADMVKTLINVTSNQLTVRHKFDSVEPPLIDNDTICFNGVDNDGHEPFVITRKMCDARSFCKTAGKPYDRLVTSTLLAVLHIARDAWDVNSDGDIYDWKAGLDLVTSISGYMPLDELEHVMA